MKVGGVNLFRVKYPTRFELGVRAALPITSVLGLRQSARQMQRTRIILNCEDYEMPVCITDGENGNWDIKDNIKCLVICLSTARFVDIFKVIPMDR